MADAICDGIVYNAHTIKIEGDSMRKRAAIAEQQTIFRNSADENT